MVFPSKIIQQFGFTTFQLVLRNVMPKLAITSSVIYGKNAGGSRGLMFSVEENGHGDPSSNPERGCLHFHIALISLRKVSIQQFSLYLCVRQTLALV